MQDDELTPSEAIRPVPIESNAKSLDRMTATLSLVYEQPEEQPVAMDAIATLVQEPGDDEPYQRKITVTDEWQRLDYGWLDGKVGHVLIINKMRVPNFAPKQTTSDEDNSQTIELSFDGEAEQKFANVEIANGSFFLFKPTMAYNVRVRCKKGRSKIHLMVMPG